MLKATGTWVCDTCGGVIKDTVEGYVVWKTDNDHKANSFRIIHQKRCDPNGEFTSSCALGDFIGSDGVARLLAFLSLGPLKQYPDTLTIVG